MTQLWTPSPDRRNTALITAFKDQVGKPDASYDALHDWSVTDLDGFWAALWDFVGFVGDKGDVAFTPTASIKDAKFFPNARVNYAQNMLRDADDRLACVFTGEDGRRETITRKGLYDLTSRIAAALRAQGISKGDRVAGFVPNCIESIAAMLAVQSLGGIWSSCSPDFGVAGVEDRFGQIEPKLLFAADGYFYNGKTIDSRPVLAELAGRLPSVQKVVVWPYAMGGADVSDIAGGITLADFIADHPTGEIQFEPMGLRDPGFILFSSGTTGKPKCITHCAAGVLLQHLKEMTLHANIKPGDNLFFFTTCGWMMWNWLVSGLAAGATLILYDGNPFYPAADRLFQLAQDERITQFGTSAKAIDHAKKMGVRPRDSHDFSSVTTVLSTGSPLAHESFDYVYDAWGDDIHLASISGGTDICGCFIGGLPTAPVTRGEIQAPLLGMGSAVFGDDAQPISGAPGELVCTTPHPSMPLGFWGDTSGERYHAAYFDTFDNVWCHGDWLTRTQTGGFVVAGRSDATLNPGGVRIGTAEIYRQVERIPQVTEAIVIGQDYDNDQRVVLFVRLAQGAVLDDDLKRQIKTEIRTNASPRHVPAVILEVADIPRTKSGKIVELAVRDVIHGRPVRNQTALANPEALELYRGLKELEG